MEDCAIKRFCQQLVVFCSPIPRRLRPETWCLEWQGDEVFHPTSLVNFRHRLEEHPQSALGFTTILTALAEAGLVSRQSRQRLDSTQRFGRVARMSRLDCVRESLRLGLQEQGPHGDALQAAHERGQAGAGREDVVGGFELDEASRGPSLGFTQQVRERLWQGERIAPSLPPC